MFYYMQVRATKNNMKDTNINKNRAPSHEDTLPRFNNLKQLHN
jgi:hypothetical protein